MIHLLDVRLHSDNCFKATETFPQAAPKQVTRVVRHRPYTGLYFEALPAKRKGTSNTVARGPSNGSSQRVSSLRRFNTNSNTNNNNFNYNPNVSHRNGEHGLPAFQETRTADAILDIPKANGNSDDEKMEKQLNEVFKKVTIIDTKLSNLQEQLDTNSITRQTEELMASASESYRIGISLGDRLQAVEKVLVYLFFVFLTLKQ